MQALAEAEQIQNQMEVTEQLPGEMQDPAAEVARLKLELEKEKREKQELASQLSQQQLHEGGQYESLPSERFRQTAPRDQERTNSQSSLRETQEAALQEVLPGQMQVQELDLEGFEQK